MAISHPILSVAQSDSWTNNPNKKITGKADKAKGKFNDYKGRVQNWGMDTGLKHTFLIGGKLNSDGWSCNAYFLAKRRGGKSNVLQLGFSEIKHEKQVKQKGKGDPAFGNPQPYVFGKVNNLYTMQLGIGQERVLLPSVMEGNVSVAFRYSFGLSLAMLKPYYLKLIYRENMGGIDTSYLEEHKYTATDSARFLNPNMIFGASKWQKGLNEIQYIPGGYLELSFVILPGNTKTFVQAITLGVNGSYYTSKLPVMVDHLPYRWNACLFAGLAVGKRH